MADPQGCGRQAVETPCLADDLEGYVAYIAPRVLPPCPRRAEQGPPSFQPSADSFVDSPLPLFSLFSAQGVVLRPSPCRQLVGLPRLSIRRPTAAAPHSTRRSMAIARFRSKSGWPRLPSGMRLPCPPR